MVKCKTKNVQHRKLIPFGAPMLRFAHDQSIEDPKDGLFMFGPPEKPIGIEYGVIGTNEGIARFEKWAGRLNKAIPARQDYTSSVMFPGFEALFRTAWPQTPRVKIQIDEEKLDTTVRITDAHQRVFDTVDLYTDRIKTWVKEEDAKVSLWFVIIPEKVWKLCRPMSTISKKEGVQPEVHLTHKRAQELLTAPDFFDEANNAAEKHLYENHFHNQLKAKLLECEAITQIVRETTIAPYDFLDRFGKPTRSLQDEATVAWNLATSIYYKSGAKPWTLADIREGVCYIGLVFKRTNRPGQENEACCGAQMFLHTGEGIVFKGSVGPWATSRLGDFHLPRDKAKEIIAKCIDSYVNWHGSPPNELFIHGRTGFNREEINGFKDAAPEGTAITGIQIRRPNDLKLYRDGKKPILRGLAMKLDQKNAFLWTSGYIPKLLTYPGREVPTPLRIRVVFGDTKIEQVLKDIMALTKLNYNACIFSDGFPVTLRFANDIGEILTAVPEATSKPLPFRHYI